MKEQKAQTRTMVYTNIVYKMLLLGARRRDILNYAELNHWGVSARAIDSYIAKAKKEIAEVTAEERKAALGTALKRLEQLYYTANVNKDLKTALSIQKEINRLHGLDVLRVEQRIEISDTENLRHTVDAAIAADPDARARITAALREGT